MSIIHEKLKKDPHYLFKLEQEIAKKYGQDAIKSLREWDEGKDEEYHQQIKEMYDKWKERQEAGEVLENNGYLVKGKLFNKEARTCRLCGRHSFSTEDDPTLFRYKVCAECFDKKASKILREGKI